MTIENKDKELETASVTLAEAMHFVGAIDGFHIDLDAEEHAGGMDAGPQPHRLLLLALAGCTAMEGGATGGLAGCVCGTAGRRPDRTC